MDKTYVDIRELKNAYTAALLDGEGSFGLYPNPSGNGSVQIKITISNNSKPLLESIQEYYKCGRFTRLQSGNCWAWVLSQAPEVVRFLTSVLPYLTIKYEEAKIVLAYATHITTSNNKKLTEDEMLARSGFLFALKEAKEIRKELYSGG